MADSPESIRAAIIVATGTIVAGVFSKIPGHNEALRDMDAIVKQAMTSIKDAAKANLGVNI